MLCYLLPYSWGYSSVVEHSTADRVQTRVSPGHLFISKQGYIIMLCYLLPYSRGYSSVVENSTAVQHSTADREVPGSNPGVPDI